MSTLSRLQALPAPTFHAMPPRQGAQTNHVERLHYRQHGTAKVPFTIAIVAGKVHMAAEEQECARCGDFCYVVGSVMPTDDHTEETPTLTPEDCGSALDGHTPETDDDGYLKVYCHACREHTTQYVEVPDDDVGCLPVKALLDADGDAVVTVPDWIEAFDDDLDADTIASLSQCGCDGCAYGPTFYHVAETTMSAHGDDVLEYLSDNDASVVFDVKHDSWTGFASKLLCYAVDMWAWSANDAIEEHKRGSCFYVARNA